LKFEIEMTDQKKLNIPKLSDVKKAHERISPHIHCTPIVTSQFLDSKTGAKLFFKCENFQKAGAFKVRGASNAVFGLDDATAAKGVATHSSGNHALSLSYAAGRRGIPCTVVMPKTAPQAKKRCSDRLWRHNCRMRAVNHKPRGGICRSGCQDGR
jgi:threonine dehydratase